MLMKVHQDLIDPFWRANETNRWGAYEVCCSALSIALCLMLIAALALGVLELIGLKSLTQIYGFSFG